MHIFTNNLLCIFINFGDNILYPVLSILGGGDYYPRRGGFGGGLDPYYPQDYGYTGGIGGVRGIGGIRGIGGFDKYEPRYRKGGYRRTRY